MAQMPSRTTPAPQGASRTPLSQRQAAILAYITARVAEHGYPPTIREIGAHFCIRSTNGVADHLKALTRKGYLTHQEAKSRTLRPTALAYALYGSSGAATADPALAAGNDDRPTAPEAPPQAPRRRGNTDGAAQPDRCVSVPLLGRVAAGQPILAPEEARAEEHLFVDSSWLGGGADVFALKVAGDSMIEDGIFDGDTVFVRRRDYADRGEMAVVMIDNEATIKRYFPEGERLRLQPANASMAPIYVYPSAAHTVQVVGLVVGVYRRLQSC